MNRVFDLHQGGADVLWGEIPPSEHLLQIYDSEVVFLDTLEGFVAGGLRNGDGVIVIATADHLIAIEDRLHARGQDVLDLQSAGQYIPLGAEEVLSTFMVNGWPDEGLFDDVVSRLVAQARGGDRRVRAFGEMVALMWERGDHDATVRLEYLWHRLCGSRGFSLFCAYPRVGFTGDSTATIGELCALHSCVIPGTRHPGPQPLHGAPEPVS